MTVVAGLGEGPSGPGVDSPAIRVGLPGGDVDILHRQRRRVEPGSSCCDVRQESARLTAWAGAAARPGIPADPPGARPGGRTPAPDGRCSACVSMRDFGSMVDQWALHQAMVSVKTVGASSAWWSTRKEALGPGIEIESLPESLLELLPRRLGPSGGVVPVVPAVAVTGDGQVPAGPGLAWLLPAEELSHWSPVAIQKRLTIGPDQISLRRSDPWAGWLRFRG